VNNLHIERVAKFAIILGSKIWSKTMLGANVAKLKKSAGKTSSRIAFSPPVDHSNK